MWLGYNLPSYCCEPELEYCCPVSTEYRREREREICSEVEQILRVITVNRLNNSKFIVL